MTYDPIGQISAIEPGSLLEEMAIAITWSPDLGHLTGRDVRAVLEALRPIAERIQEA